MAWVFGLLHRLGRDIEMFADIFRRRAREMRDLVSHLLPQLVETPAQRRQPAEATFDHHDLQIAIALEQAFHDQAGDHSLGGGRVLGRLLDIERRPAAIGHCPAAVAERMDTDREPGFHGRLVDRPIALAAMGFGATAQHQHLHEIAVAARRPRHSHRAPPPRP